jgi:transposase
MGNDCEMELQARQRELLNFPVKETGELSSILKPYGIGIDCHKNFYQICILVKLQEPAEYNQFIQNEPIRRYEFECKTIFSHVSEAKKKVLEILDNNGIYCLPEDLHYTCESTGPYHKPLVISWKGSPTIINPLLANPSRRKTDVLDARLLAHYDITGLFPSSYIVKDEISAIRQILQFAEKSKTMRIATTNKINNILISYGNTISTEGSITKANIRPQIEDFCNKRPAFSLALQQAMPDNINDLILHMFNQCDINQNTYENYLKNAIEALKKCKFHTKDKEISGKELLNILCTCPGIGEKTALVFIINIADINRFDHQKKLVSYCGFDPTLKISAGKVTSQTRRKGNKDLHTIIMRAANSLLNHKSEQFGKWGYVIYKKNAKGGYKKASCAIGRKLCTAMYNMWKLGEPFSYEKYNAYEDEIREIPIIDTKLSKRVIKMLYDKNITTTTQLYSKFQGGTLFTKGIGVKTIMEIQECLKNQTLRKLKLRKVQN